PGVAVLGEAFLDQCDEAGIDRRIDLRRHSWRILLEPEPIHSSPALLSWPLYNMLWPERLASYERRRSEEETWLFNPCARKKTPIPARSRRRGHSFATSNRFSCPGTSTHSPTASPRTASSASAMCRSSAA